MKDFLARFQKEASRALIDRYEEVALALCCFVAGGNLLIEDTPGVGKTTLVKVMARLLGLDFKRVQFTNDLLPSDILGGRVFDATRGTFSFHPGPIFAQLVLGDELNRASPRTQSAALQAMDEHEVTIEGETHLLPSPFLFVGTQNPREHAGTAPLPESQLDRFLMRIALGQPSRETRRKLLDRARTRSSGITFDFSTLTPLADPPELLVWQAECSSVHVAEPVSNFILDLLEAAERRGGELSPRAALGLQRAAQARAYLEGREHVRPDDIVSLFCPVAVHRMGRLASTAGGDGKALGVAREVLAEVRSP
ncbi:MAG: AAA family ATPase [Terrimicrobiaceae bacterium]